MQHLFFPRFTTAKVLRWRFVWLVNSLISTMALVAVSILSIGIINMFFTACASGTHGQDCSQNCTCQNGAQCDPISGHCTCRPGWQGLSCDKGMSNTAAIVIMIFSVSFIPSGCNLYVPGLVNSRGIVPIY